jgi:hemolysin activation/secretion protein
MTTMDTNRKRHPEGEEDRGGPWRKTVRTMIMKRVTLLLCLAGVSSPALAQVPDANVPPQRTPKPVPNESQPAQLPALPPAEPPKAEPDPNDEVLVKNLRGIDIVEIKGTQPTIKTNVAGLIGLNVESIPLLSGPDFQARMEAYLGHPLTINVIFKLQRDIILYCRDKNRPLVDVIVPKGQALDPDNAALQVWFLEGKVSNIDVDNPGRKWFSDQAIRSQVRLQQGDVVDSGILLSDLDWLNRNPFRQVDVLFRQTTNAVGINALGKSDIVLKVQDRFPVRFYGGYENTGTEVTGKDRFVLGLNAGQVFGWDHQFNYQYTTDTGFDLLQAHSASYEVPLPWRHYVTVFGSYVDAKSQFQDNANDFNSRGESYQVGLRYNVPLVNLGRYRHQLTGGLDFKDSNNNLEFGGGTVLDSSTQIAQLQGAYSGVLSDPWGQTSWGVEGFYSPGDVTGRNDDEHFNELRIGSKANYVYGRFSLERVTQLPLGFTSFVRGSLQLANERLLPSELYGLGGYRSVRGYPERLVNGDEGWGLNVELRSPPMDLGRLTHDPSEHAYLQPLAFFDYGSAHIVDPEFNEDRNVDLASVGLGLRFTVGRNLAFRFDYGFQLMEKGLSGRDTNAHIGALLSF